VIIKVKALDAGSCLMNILTIVLFKSMDSPNNGPLKLDFTINSNYMVLNRKKGGPKRPNVIKLKVRKCVFFFFFFKACMVNHQECDSIS
jgi:hypothetical protein